MEAQSLEGPMRIGVVAVVGLVVAAGAAAQQNTQAQQDAQVQQKLQEAKSALDYGGCPGALSARRQSPGGTIWTVSREDAKDSALKQQPGNSGVYVALSAKGALREIELSVSYLPPGTRVVPVGAPDKKDTRQKTFEISANGQKDVDGNLLVGPAFQITSVHLISATFADGGVWRAPSEDSCTVEPSLFLPVVAKR